MSDLFAELRRHEREYPSLVHGPLCGKAADEIDRLQNQLVKARADAIKECAKFVEQHQETISETSGGSERYLSPRKVGNMMALAYADGLRTLLTDENRCDHSATICLDGKWHCQKCAAALPDDHQSTPADTDLQAMTLSLD